MNIEVFVSLVLKSIRNFLFVGAMRCSGLFPVFFLHALDSDWNVPYGFSISWVLFSYHITCINSSLLGLPVVWNNFGKPVAAFVMANMKGIKQIMSNQDISRNEKIAFSY